MTSTLFLDICIYRCGEQPVWKSASLFLIFRDRYAYFVLYFPLLENLFLSKISKLLCREDVPAIHSSCLERDAIKLPREKYRMTSFTSSEVLTASLFQLTCHSDTSGNKRVLCLWALQQISCFCFLCRQNLLFSQSLWPLIREAPLCCLCLF